MLGLPIAISPVGLMTELELFPDVIGALRRLRTDPSAGKTEIRN